MCGIAGSVRYDVPALAERGTVAVMCARLRHRGPDGEGAFCGSHAALGHTRLALLDREGGAQPRTSPDGRYTLVFNGEVYDLPRLRAELAGAWRFSTRSDAEVLLAAYAAWGPRCVQRLEGMFAFFVWDAHAETGFAARDLLGIKPFVYHWDGVALRFASEAKALLPTLAAPPRADTEALLEVLVAPCFSGVERPLFAGLQYLPPGHSLRVSREGVAVERWGSHDLLERVHVPTATRAEELRGSLDAAVRRALAADVPVGVFLSGGLDSTALAAFACAQGARPPAFSVRFEGHDAYDYDRSLVVTSDDAPFAALAARELALPLTDVHVRRDELAADLAAVARQNDALPAWEQEVAQHRLARAASAAGCRAVLVGDAADETHYGYHFVLDPRATERPAHILERFADAPIAPRAMRDPRAHFEDKYRALARGLGHRWGDARERTLATTCVVIERWLPRLLHNGDVHTMAHGVEARVPFADRDVLRVARGVEPAEAIPGGVEKSVLREALRGVVPEPIRVRRKSALPKDQGSAERYQSLARDTLVSHGDLLSPVLDIDALRALCAPGRTLSERDRALLFRVITLAHWACAWEVRIA